MFDKTSDFHLFMSPGLALASSFVQGRALSIFMMESLPRLIHILHHNIEAANTEALEIIYEISWEWLPKRVRLSVACASSFALHLYRMVESQRADLTWVPQETWYQAAGREHLEELAWEAIHEARREREWQTWCLENGYT